jgi:ProP effector
MSHPSLKEQLQAVASQLPQPTAPSTAPSKPAMPKPVAKSKPAGPPMPPRSSQKPKPKWLDYVQYGVELLRAYFPDCFKAMNEVKPLKKGIKQDLLLRLSTLSQIVTDDKACMVKSLAYYVNTAAYHKSVTEGTMRIDLDGQPAGVVSAEEATYSTERYQAKLQAKQKLKPQSPVAAPGEAAVTP